MWRFILFILSLGFWRGILPRKGNQEGRMIGRLLQNEDVKKELHLKPDQVQKIQQCIQRVRAKHKDEFERVRLLGPEGRQQMPELNRKMAEETGRALEQAKILQPEQMNRLQQIARQQQGARAFMLPEVTAALKLTDDQKAGIRALLEDTGKKVGGLLQGKQGNPDEPTREKIAALRKETLEKTTALLSAEQQATWNDLRGEPLEVKFERGQGGGGPMGGGDF